MGERDLPGHSPAFLHEIVTVVDEQLDLNVMTLG